MRALSRSEFSRGHAAGVRPHLGIVAAKSHDFIGTLIVSGIQMVEAITRNEQGHVGSVMSPHTHTLGRAAAQPRGSRGSQSEYVTSLYSTRTLDVL